MPNRCIQKKISPMYSLVHGYAGRWFLGMGRVEMYVIMHVAFLAWTRGGIEMRGGVLFSESLCGCDFYGERLIYKWIFLAKVC